MTSCVIFVAGTGISGGANVIFEHAIRARDNGIAVSFALRDKIDPSVDFSWHRVARQPGFEWLSYEDLNYRRFDIAMATYWPTCFELWRANVSRFVYFVQSVESRFPPPDDLLGRLGAESTYRLPLGLVTEASYIQHFLSRIHGQKSDLVLNGISKDLFHPSGTRIGPEPRGLRVLVEGSLEPERKGTVAAIELSRLAGVAELWLLTLSSVSEYPGVDRVFAEIPQTEVGEIYRSCDVLVKLSRVEGMFGPPLEMFHCGGTAVTYDVTGHEHYIKHGYNGLVAPMLDKQRVVTYLNDLQRWPDLLRILKKGAVDTAAQWPSWDESSRVFWSGVMKAAERSAATRSTLEQVAQLFYLSCRLTRRPPESDMADFKAEIKAVTHRINSLGAELSECHQQIAALSGRMDWLVDGKLPRELTALREELESATAQLQELKLRLNGAVAQTDADVFSVGEQARAAMDCVCSLSGRLDAVLKRTSQSGLQEEFNNLSRQVRAVESDVGALYNSRIWKTLSFIGGLFPRSGVKR